MDVSFEAVRFRRGTREVLDIPALTFASGRVTALLGPNGSGKSTTLRLIAALERPAEGTISLGGRPVRADRETRTTIAYAFQDAVFLGGTLRSNLDLALRLRNLDAAERARRIAETAEACGIAQLLDRDAHRLSGGEAQRANLARALALRAPVTLLDEPLTGLDGNGRRQLLHDLPILLRRFTTTVILVTHDRDEALRLADDLVVLMEGRVHASGAKGAVFRAPPDPETAAFFGYTVLRTEAGTVAITPGGLRAGNGEVCFELTVEAVIDLGSHREATGTINGTRVSVPIDAAVPEPGAILAVCASAAVVVRYG
jgi:ABC-type sugar transport system ATPase subunit